MIHQNSSAGIIMSNQSLVLQQIDRNAAGIYTCQATNLEGQGVSNDLSIPVKCKPFMSFSYFSMIEYLHNSYDSNRVHDKPGQMYFYFSIFKRIYYNL